MTESIGRYEIHEELGRGGMATVFRGFDPRFKREVAIKLLPREFLHDPNFRARFEREATTIAALEHSAIVPVYDFGEEDGLPYLVMRFMPGGSLAERLDDQQLPLEETAQILNRIAGALDFAHSKGVVHRDLKPANILFDQHGDAYLGDFGIVKLTEEAATLTGTGGIVGTPAYMSPEQARGKGEIDRRSDLYSLGVILFQMLTGNQPYEADTPIGLAFMHITEPTPDVLKSRPDLPQGMGTFIQKAMAKEKDDRFGTAQELAGAFERSTTGDGAKEGPEAAEIEPTMVEFDPTLVEPEPADEAEVSEPEPETQAPKLERPPSPARKPRPARRSLLPVLGIAGVIVIGGGIALFALLGRSSLLAPGPEPTASQTTSPSASPTAPSSATARPPATITMTPTPEFDPRAMVEIARPLDGEYDIHSVAWSPDGSKLAALERIYRSFTDFENGALYVWDGIDLQTTLTRKAVNNTYPEVVAWSADSARLASTGSSGIIQIWNAETWEIDDELDITALTGRTVGSTSAAEWSPAAASILATGSNDGRIHIWQAEQGVPLLEICCPVFSRGSGTLAWSADGTLIAGMTGTTTETLTAMIWDAQSGEVLNEIAGGYRSLDLSPSGDRLLGIGWNALRRADYLFVWDVVSGNEVMGFELSDFSRVARWSPDGKYIAVATRYTVQILEGDSGALIHTLEGWDPAVEVPDLKALSWSPDGTKLAVGSLDGSVRVFGNPGS